MRKEPTLLSDPRIAGAVATLRPLLAGHYPSARFAVFERDDPKGVRLQATVNLEDTDAVMDVVIDALYDIQVERGLPVSGGRSSRWPAWRRSFVPRVVGERRSRCPKHQP